MTVGRQIRRRSTWILAVCGLPACKGVSSSRLAHEEADSAGIRIVVSHSPTSSDVWQLDSAPVVDIGTTSTDSLYAIRGVVRMGTGFVVSAGGSYQLHGYDALGRPTRAYGRQGSGPGELRMATALFGCGSGTAVADQREIESFDSVGTYRRTTPLGGPLVGGFAELTGITTGCDALLLATPRALPLGGDETTTRFPVTLWVAAVDASHADSIATFPGPRLAVIRLGANQPPTAVRRPWDGAPLFAAGADLYVARPDEGEVRTYDPAGHLKRVSRLKTPREPVSREERRAFAEKRYAYLARFPAEGIVFVPLADEHLPDERPLFHSMIVGADSSIWLQQYADHEAGYPKLFRSTGRGGSTRWYVIDSQGVWAAIAEVPTAFQPHAATTDALLGVWREPDDTERVRAYRIKKRKRPSRTW